MDLPLLLAQDQAEKGVSLIRQVLEGGVSMVCAVVAVACAIAVVFMFRKNAELAKENSGLEKDFRKKTEDLLREMLDRGEDSIETQGKNTQVVKDMTEALRLLTTRVDAVERVMDRLKS